MKDIKKILASGLILTTLLPGVAFAKTTVYTSDDLNFCKPGVIVNKGTNVEKNQLLRLVEKYAPETLDAWMHAIRDRKTIKFDIQNIKNSEEYKEKKLEYKNELKEEFKSGKFKKAEFKDYATKRKNERKENMARLQKERQNIHKELKEAIKENDKYEIRADLNKLLKDFQYTNEDLQVYLTKLESIL